MDENYYCQFCSKLSYIDLAENMTCSFCGEYKGLIPIGDAAEYIEE